MSLARHVRLCNAHDPARLLPLVAGDARIGLVRRDNAEALKRFGAVFAVEEACVRLVARGDVERVSAAVDSVVDALVGDGLVPKWRNETFDVGPRWGMPPVFRLDRGAVPFFGVRAYGVHLNGYRRDGATLSLWIGRRAADKKVAPDKLDNLVAGGIGSSYGATDTLVKESEEEAGIPAGLIAQARPAGALSYRMATPVGLRDDVLFVYDWEVPPDFQPVNRDGELVGFELMPAEAVLERVHATDDFKFNVNLVILDFALRHGLLRPEDAEYLEVASGLHRALD